MNDPLGSSATAQLNFGIDFTDTIVGNLLALAGLPFDNAPVVRFRLGESPAVSDMTFFAGLVVDTTTGQIISGPPFPLPEPSSFIDIKPGSFPNAINPKSKGVIPVAILTTNTFDATTVDPLSVKFGPNGAAEAHGRGHYEDVDEDGDLDLVLHFRTQETGIQCGDTSASLTGETGDGEVIQGADMITTVGCNN
jgi:hypothetical protein